MEDRRRGTTFWGPIAALYICQAQLAYGSSAVLQEPVDSTHQSPFATWTPQQAKRAGEPTEPPTKQAPRASANPRFSSPAWPQTRIEQVNENYHMNCSLNSSKMGFVKGMILDSVSGVL